MTFNGDHKMVYEMDTNTQLKLQLNNNNNSIIIGVVSGGMGRTTGDEIIIIILIIEQFRQTVQEKTILENFAGADNVPELLSWIS